MNRRRVAQLSARDGVPPPLASLRMGEVWRARDVCAWVAATGRGTTPQA